MVVLVGFTTRDAAAPTLKVTGRLTAAPPGVVGVKVTTPTGTPCASPVALAIMVTGLPVVPLVGVTLSQPAGVGGDRKVTAAVYGIAAPVLFTATVVEVAVPAWPVRTRLAGLSETCGDVLTTRVTRTSWGDAPTTVRLTVPV
jgi:hypothetical protein